MKLQMECNWCGKKIMKYLKKNQKHYFCSKRCLGDFSNKKKNPIKYKELKDYTNMSQNLSELNRKLNPVRMTPKTREKLRNKKLNTGSGKSYAKLYGRHEHRIVAEKMLGRKLKKGEVVHHIDGNKRNNDKNNLMVLPSQSEHAKLHIRENKLWEGGDVL